MTSDETPKDPQEEKEYSAYVSPRLRSKMGGGRYDDEEEEKGPGAMIAVIGLAVVIVVCGGLFLMGQSNAKKKAAGQAAEAAEAAKQAAADSAATADSLMRLAAADSLARASSTTMPHPGGAAAAKTPESRVPVEKAPAAGTTAGAVGETAPVVTPKMYGIAVGSFLFEDRANEEKSRLAAATSLDARVVPKTEGGTTTYQVVLGLFDSRGAASTKGNELLSAGTVTESTIVPIKKY